MKQIDLSSARRRAASPLTALVLASTLAGGALVAVPQARALLRPQADAAPVTIQRIYKAGDTDRYEFVTDSTVNVPQLGKDDVVIRVSMTIKETTKEVKPDGSVVLDGAVEKATAKFGEQEQDLTSLAPQWTQTRNKDGEIVNTKFTGADNPFAEQIGSGLQELTQAQAIFYPPKAVKVGDTWPIKAPVNKNKEVEEKTAGTAKLEAREMIGGIETVKITVNTDREITKPEKAKVHFEGTGNIDPKDGKIVTMTGKAEGTGIQVKKSEFTIKRLFGNEDKKAADAKKP